MINYPKIKTRLLPYKKNSNVIRFGAYQENIAREIETDDINELWELIKYMDGTKSVNSIAEHFNMKFSDFNEILQSFIDAGLLEEQNNIPVTFSNEEVEYYKRNINLFFLA